MDGRVLVVGAGIAGLAVANALHRYGLDAVVVDRLTGPPDAGLALNLPANGVRALGALGFADAVDQLGEPVRRREYRNARGKLLFAVDEAAFWGDGAGSRCVRRADLHAMLASGVPAETVRWDTPVDDLRLVDDKALVGDEGWDFVVGADGVRSAVRAAAFGQQPLRSGLLSAASWRFMAPNPGVECWTVWSGSTGTLLLIPAGDNEVYGYASATRGGATGSGPAWLTTTFAEFPSPVRTVVAHVAGGAGVLYHSPVEEVRIPRWSKGRVVLIGDAAHATAPVWAQGGALAVEDALVLAELLSTETDWTSIGVRYELRRRPRVEHVQAMTDRLSHAARLPAWLRDIVVPRTGPRTYTATYEALRAPVLHTAGPPAM
ncbi:FAD-dependent monooxygenase [Micromonospora thermarum]|uniref:NAD(P)-binding protein n=1 Tax=Micromonospora thermarum TaxID=2720024 RepID=A0ABX0Z2D5_9ACTN|nr:FAD-dependent monooxygenase [Micromonospora thermarum]NJP31952.1 NAD(P)-binding protein [Micromonospora thermarum]